MFRSFSFQLFTPPPPQDTLSDTSEKEQTKVPMHVENWLHRVVDQIGSDTDIRNEGKKKGGD